MTRPEFGGIRQCGSASARSVMDAYPLPPGAVSRQVEVTASFCGADSGSTDRYQIRLAALSEEPGEVKAIWNGDSLLDQVLLPVARTLTMKPGNHGWQTESIADKLDRVHALFAFWFCRLEGWKVS